jgi:hypothetical protein
MGSLKQRMKAELKLQNYFERTQEEYLRCARRAEVAEFEVPVAP